MRPYVALGCALAMFQTLVAGASIPEYFRTAPIVRRDLSSNTVRRELGQKLSKTTTIYGKDDTRYHDATSRWNLYVAPNYEVVIEPGRESDIPTIVKYCNDNSIDFLLQNRGHGNSKSLSSFNGIQINMVNIRNIDIQPDRKSAWFGGGTYDGQVSRYLWERGFVTTTGSCDCVGMMGPGLGGGHGRHEGLYGMISDNIRQLNLVLANGTMIRVSKTRYPDLFWGMQGAGHNFGIVTSFEMNIFPRGPDTWHYHNYIWRGDKLDAVFTALNNLHKNGSTPVNMALNIGYFLLNTTITDKEPVLWWTFAYRGSAKEAETHLKPFNAIQNVWEESGDVPYPQIAVVQLSGEDSASCQHNNGFQITSTVNLQVYNLTAEHQIYDGFVKRINDNLELAKGAGIVHEGYSTAAVERKNPADSAYPFRSDHHLNLFDVVIAPDSGLEDAAWEWAQEVADQWNAGQPDRIPTAYVNYANGLESVEARYGHESWRLERLRALKAKYDPNNRMRFYNPIVQ